MATATRTSGAQIVPARPNELRRVLMDLTAEDLSQLDTRLGATMDRKLGRELLATRMPMTDSVFVCLYNLEPSAMIAMHRGRLAARIHALVVCRDQRRKGLARTLLTDAAQRGRKHGLEWLWMLVPSANLAGTRCALSCGFRRYRPQYLHRSMGHALKIETRSVYLKVQYDAQASRCIRQWQEEELRQGDAWIEPLVSRELMPLMQPEEGLVWACMIGEHEIGCVHMSGTTDHPVVSLWLDKTVWNTPDEFACLRAVVSTLEELPSQIDLWLGSGDHLRVSAAYYKFLEFTPALGERILFARHLEDESAD